MYGIDQKPNKWLRQSCVPKISSLVNIGLFLFKQGKGCQISQQELNTLPLTGRYYVFSILFFWKEVFITFSHCALNVFPCIFCLVLFFYILLMHDCLEKTHFCFPLLTHTMLLTADVWFFPTPSNSLQHQLSVLQCNSILTLTEVSTIPTSKGLSPIRLPPTSDAKHN